MGPSGAGKSTLLYALMGTARYGSTRGRLWINGREMRLARLRRILGYVPQVRPALSQSTNSHLSQLPSADQTSDSHSQSQLPASHPTLHRETWIHSQTAGAAPSLSRARTALIV